MASRGWESVTAADVKRLGLQLLAPASSSAKPSKYHSQKAQVDGYTFDSKKEAQRYQELKLMQKAGLIQDLVLQPSFDLYGANGEQVARYVGDFQYWLLEASRTVLEDVKSPATRTRLYRLKKKLLQAQGITITEV